MSSHYEVLGVRRDASIREVKKAYERKVKALAGLPDDQRAVREKIFKEAHDVLSDHTKRLDYDSRLEEYSAPAEGTTSGAPLLIGLVVVLVTAAGIGFFLYERSKDRAHIRMEEMRAAEKAEREKRGPVEKAVPRSTPGQDAGGKK